MWRRVCVSGFVLNCIDDVFDAGLTCGAVAAAAGRWGTAGWPSGNSVVELRSWARVWVKGVRLSPRCPPRLPWLLRNCRCACVCTGSLPRPLLYPASRSTRLQAPVETLTVTIHTMHLSQRSQLKVFEIKRKMHDKFFSLMLVFWVLNVWTIERFEQ